MTLILSGTNGLSDVDGDASTPAVRGTDANSGIFFGADTVGVSTGGSEKVSVGASAVVVNDGGADVDFRVEGDTDANLLFVDASTDRVGIGTSSPVSKLDVSYGGFQNSTGAITIGADVGANTSRTNATRKFGVFSGVHYTNAEENVCIFLYDSDSTETGISYGGGPSGFNTTNVHRWFTAATNTTTSGTERMRIDSSGKVGIGTTSPNMFLEIKGGNGNQLILNNGGERFTQLDWQNNGTTKCFQFYDNTNDRMQFQTGATGGVILTNGSTAWASASDERLKDIIEPITDGLNKVTSLRSVIGKFKTDDESARRVFLIAQDVQAVLPEAVQEDKEGNLLLTYTDLIPLLVSAVKDLKAELDTVKAELDTVKAELATLKG